MKKTLESSLFKYAGVSLVALLFDVAILTICREFFKFPDIISATIGFSFGLIFVYIISVKFIFGRSKYSRSFEISIFSLIGVVGLIINDIIIAIMLKITTVYIAKLSAIFIVFSWNYLARKKLMTIKSKEPLQSE